MPTNIADTAQIVDVESHDREQLVKAEDSRNDRSWFTIIFLRIARKNYVNGERYYSINVDSWRVSKERVAAKTTSGPVNVGPCVHQ